MNRLFARLQEERGPKVNDSIMKGVASVYMSEGEKYVDQVFHSASRSFPPGLTYVGCERCTPEEEYEELTRSKNSKSREYDLSRSDIYLMKYKFRYVNPKTGVEHPIRDRYMYLPFVGEAAIMHLGGSRYHVVPVLSDKVISPGTDTVFVRLLRNKLNFKRQYHAVVIDGKREMMNVIWSQIYVNTKDGRKTSPTTKADTCVAHYLFARYGFSETFRRYAGFVPEVHEFEANNDMLLTGNFPRPDLKKYPPEKYVIVQSSQRKPNTYLQSYYPPSNLWLVIPREHWTSITKALVTGFFYVVDHFPAGLTKIHLDFREEWMVYLGNILFSASYSRTNLHDRIQEHYVSLDSCIDEIIIDKLQQRGYTQVKDFYDLLALILGDFNSFILANAGNNLSMYDKNVEVLYYVYYFITSAIFNTNFRLNKHATKRGELTAKDIDDHMNRYMRSKAVFDLAGDKIMMETVSYSGDHMYPKITAKIAEQENQPGGSRGKAKRRSVGENCHLDASMIDAGSILHLPKSNPSPTSHLNPFAQIDLKTGTVLQTKDRAEVLNHTNRLLKGRGIDPMFSSVIEDINPLEHDLKNL